MSGDVQALEQGVWRVSWIGLLPGVAPVTWEARAFLEAAPGRAVKTIKAFGRDASDALCKLEAQVLEDPWCRRMEAGILFGKAPGVPFTWRSNIVDRLMHQVALTAMEARRNPHHPARRVAILARPPHQDELAAATGSPAWHEEAAIFTVVLEQVLPPGSCWQVECPEWENLRISVTGIQLRPDAC